jgi:hypothetical protein
MIRSSDSMHRPHREETACRYSGWKRNAKAKQPYCFESNQGELFCLAGFGITGRTLVVFMAFILQEGREPISTSVLINPQVSGIALRHCSATRWDMPKVSVPSNNAFALWARSNRERLFLRGCYWAGSLSRYCFETILINEPLRDGWVHEAEI